MVGLISFFRVNRAGADGQFSCNKTIKKQEDLLDLITA